MANFFKKAIVISLVGLFALSPIVEVKKAEALFGVGDISITAGDIPRLIFSAIGKGLIQAFSEFAADYIQSLVDKIEQNYKIANFLYYTDALVSGQYVNDYLDKYTDDAFDSKMIRVFIPQLKCK